MTLQEQGRIQGGAIVLPRPVPLPEGTEVTVRIETVQPGEAPSGVGGGFRQLPFFGMWARRDDLTDSAAWVRREREQWQQRISRPG